MPVPYRFLVPGVAVALALALPAPSAEATPARPLLPRWRRTRPGATSDFDGDGKPDLAIGKWTSTWASCTSPTAAAPSRPSPGRTSTPTYLSTYSDPRRGHPRQGLRRGRLHRSRGRRPAGLAGIPAGRLRGVRLGVRVEGVEPGATRRARGVVDVRLEPRPGRASGQTARRGPAERGLRRHAWRHARGVPAERQRNPLDVAQPAAVPGLLGRPPARARPETSSAPRSRRPARPWSSGAPGRQGGHGVPGRERDGDHVPQRRQEVHGPPVHAEHRAGAGDRGAQRRVRLVRGGGQRGRGRGSPGRGPEFGFRAGVQAQEGQAGRLAEVQPELRGDPGTQREPRPVRQRDRVQPTLRGRPRPAGRRLVREGRQRGLHRRLGVVDPADEAVQLPCAPGSEEGGILGGKPTKWASVGKTVGMLRSASGSVADTFVLAAPGETEESVPGRVLTLTPPHTGPAKVVFTSPAFSIALSPVQG